MNLVAAMPEDIPQIEAWVAADPWHKNLGTEFWLTGASCFLACKIQDDGGDAAYARIEHEGEGFRLHIQFAPESVVSKRRVITTGIAFMRMLVLLAKQNNKNFIVSASESPKLIGFMRRIGFKKDQLNDFVLQVPKETNDVRT